MIRSQRTHRMHYASECGHQDIIRSRDSRCYDVIINRRWRLRDSMQQQQQQQLEMSEFSNLVNVKRL